MINLTSSLSDENAKQEIMKKPMCTGFFVKEANRPLTGTGCAHPCVYEKGRWGSSWCYTKSDRSEWGAECIPCSGKEHTSLEL